MKLRVGSKVLYRGAFGLGEPTVVTVTEIELCEGPHEKDGEPREEVDMTDVGRCCLTLDNGHWAYGEQVIKLLKE